jgi:hypothetical protein
MFHNAQQVSFIIIIIIIIIIKIEDGDGRANMISDVRMYDSVC